MGPNSKYQNTSSKFRKYGRLKPDKSFVRLNIPEGVTTWTHVALIWIRKFELVFWGILLLFDDTCANYEFKKYCICSVSKRRAADRWRRRSRRRRRRKLLRTFMCVDPEGDLCGSVFGRYSCLGDSVGSSVVGCCCMKADIQCLWTCDTVCGDFRYGICFV